MPYEGPLKLEYFPEGLLLLQDELATGFHPHLEKKLSKHDPTDVYVRLAEIAHHCDVILNATYTPKDIDKLGSILAGRLVVLRDKDAMREKAEIILPFTDNLKGE